jgi:N-acetylmuramoyl-L-alanine amidase
MSRRRRTRRANRRPGPTPIPQGAWELPSAASPRIDSRVRALLFLLVVMLLPGPVLAARLTGLSVVPGVVTVIADGPPAVAHQFALVAPYRLVIDLPAVVPAAIAAPGAGSVAAVRAAMFSPGIARLVIDLAGPLEIVSARSSASGLTITLRRVSPAAFAEQVRRGRKPLPVATGGALPVATGRISPPPSPVAPLRQSDFSLPPDLSGGRIIPSPPQPPTPVQPAIAAEGPAIAAAGPAIAASGPAIAPAGSAEPAAEAPRPPQPQRRRAPGIRPRSGGKPLVVIDAGHGGKDVGAISVLGGYEKDVTLAIARLTARRLERSGKVRVQLTRDDDRFIPLGGRVAIARRARADLFISIHADAASNAEARGASVYTLSAVASDAVAARLAARENKADIIGGVNLGVEAPEVGDIMIDLSRRATGNVSVQFADILQASLNDRIRFRGEFHHFAGFVVLKAPDVPSVLLETGYVTNRDDARLLFSGEGRQKFADGIARAIERHLLGD